VSLAELQLASILTCRDSSKQVRAHSDIPRMTPNPPTVPSWDPQDFQRNFLSVQQPLKKDSVGEDPHGSSEGQGLLLVCKFSLP
jgi:hypothetical protein